MDEGNIKKTKIVTHSGSFHTDEVFACAILSLMHNGNVEIVRSRDPEVWATGDYVVDAGGIYDVTSGRFDHHQIGGAGMRENSVPYSSVGIVWKEYGDKLTDSAYVTRIIDERLIQPIDAGDNGIDTFFIRDTVAPYLLQDAISVFRPGWNEARTEDDGFFEAMSFAKRIFEREIIRAKAEEEGKQYAEIAYQNADDKRIIILDDHYPWYDALFPKPEPLFVVKPDRGLGGKWKIETVRKDVHSFGNRKDLPLAWAGKSGRELSEITGVPDALFCHNKRFVAVAGSKEGALALAKLAVES